MFRNDLKSSKINYCLNINKKKIGEENAMFFKSFTLFSKSFLIGIKVLNL